MHLKNRGIPVNIKTLSVLTIVTILILLAALFFRGLRYTPTSNETTPTFPNLMNQLESIATIQIAGYNQQFEITQVDGSWILPEKANYPVALSKIRSVLIGLAELNTLNTFTGSPTRFDQLDLDNIQTANSNATQLILTSETGQNIVQILIGQQRSVGDRQQSFYIRDIDGEGEQIQLVSGNLPALSDPLDWVDRTLVPFTLEHIQSIEILDGDFIQLAFARNLATPYEFTLIENGLDEPNPSPSELNQIAEQFTHLQLNDILPQDTIDFSDPDSTIVITSIDSIRLALQVKTIDNDYYIKVTASQIEAITNPDVQIQLQNLRRKTNNWLFSVPSYAGQSLSLKSR